MSIFRKNKKTILNTAVLDLRSYTAEALRKIKLINAAVVILPENPSGEFMEAYSAISAKNIASELKLDTQTKICNISGIGELTENNIDYDAVYNISGIAYISNADSDKPINVTASGIVVYEKSSNINFINKSGISAQVASHYENRKMFAGDVAIDNHFIELIDNMLIFAGRDIRLEDDVAEDTLISKNIYFAAGRKIICSRKIKSAVQTKSFAGRGYEYK